jgi:thiol-disulfide isomerase/thioredoxin
VATGPRVGDVAPDFTAANLAGGTITLGSLKGRYVLLDFWATWCAPCVASLPALRRIHDTFEAGNRLSVLGLNLDDQPTDAKAFLEARSLPWAQAFLGGSASDTDDVLSRYAISFIPTYILLGPDGKLIHRGDNLDAVAEILRRELK